MSQPKYAIVLILLCSMLMVPHPAISEDRDVLAIFNLTPTNLEALGYNGDILYELTYALEKEKTIEVMPRREMEDVLFQEGLSQCTNADMVLTAGKALGVNFILYGNVTNQGGKILTELNLMGVRQMEIIKAWSLTFSGKEALQSKIQMFIKELNYAIDYQDQLIPPPVKEPAPKIEIANLRAKCDKSIICLSWDFDSGLPILGFNIYRSKNTQGPFQFLGKTDTNFFNDNKITKGVYYYYHIGIVLNSGKEIKSEEIAQTKYHRENAPYPPLIVGGQGYIGRTEIKFVPSLQNEQNDYTIKQYKIYRKKETGDQLKHIGTIDMKEDSQLSFIYNDKENIEEGDSISYTVSSIDNNNIESCNSDPISLSSIESPETWIDQENLPRKIILSWHPVEYILGYNIFRKLNDNDKWELIDKVRDPVVNYHADTELEDGTAYQYCVTVFDNVSETRRCKAIKGMTKPKPVSVDGLNVTTLKNTISVNWIKNPEPDISHYLIYRSRNKKEWQHIETLDSGTSSFFDNNLKPENKYAYRLIAVDADEIQSEPSDSSETTSQIPLILEVTKDNLLRHIELAWQPIQNVDGYYLYRKSEHEDWRKVGEVKGANKSEFIDEKDFSDGTVYTYRLTTYDKEDETSPSNEVSAKTKDLPIPPGDLTLESGLVKSVNLSWVSVNDPDIGGYAIYRGRDLKNLVQIKKVKKFQTRSYKDKGSLLTSLEHGTNYFYVISSYNLFGAEGDVTQAVEAKTKPRPSRIKNFKVAGSKDRIIVEWPKSPETDIRRYMLYRKTGNGNWLSVKKLKENETLYEDVKIKAAKAYQYMIIAQDRDGLKSDPVESQQILSPLIETEN